MADVPSTSWDESTGFISDSTVASSIDDKIRTLLKQIRQIIEVDHKMESSGQGSTWGMHNVIRLLVQGSDPSIETDEGILYTKDVNSKAELFWKDEDGNVKQLTDDGYLKGDLIPTSQPSTLVNGMIWIE